MKVNHNITFTLSKEEDDALCIAISIYEHVLEEETIPQEIRDHASKILDEIYEFNTRYLDD